MACGEPADRVVEELATIAGDDWPAFVMARLRLGSQLAHPVLRQAAGDALELLERAADVVWATRHGRQSPAVAAVA